MWAQRWGIADVSGAFDHADFLEAARIAGTSENGVFAAKLMWGQLDDLVATVRSVYPDDASDTDLALLGRAFGNLRFVYLSRTDALAQAVSWLRAEQTGIWWETDETGTQMPGAAPSFDRVQLDALLSVIDDHNAAWRGWFPASAVSPYEVRYEDVDTEPETTVLSVLRHLGLRLPDEVKVESQYHRLADRLNAEWIDRYRAAPI